MKILQLQKQKSVQGIAYYSNAQDRHLAMQEHSNRTPLLLIHGVGLRAESWQYQIDYFSAKHYTVYAIDMPGHGDSNLLPHDPLELEHLVKAVSDFIDEVIGQPVILLGHSLGAMIATSLAAKHSDKCKGLVALNGVYNRSKSAEMLVRKRALELMANPDSDVSSAPIKRWFGDVPEARDAANAEYCRYWLESGNRLGYIKAYDVFSRNTGPSDNVLNSIMMPALYLTGEHDFNSSQEMSNAMAMKSPRGESIIIKNSKHMTPMTHAMQVNKALESFIEDTVILANALHITSEKENKSTVE